MNKVLFLYKSNSPLKIIFYFLISKLSNFYFKNKIKRKKRQHKLLIDDKEITNDYFSPHSFNFFYYLKNLKPNFNYLEIGAYEGNSAMFVANNFSNAKIYCVDNWHKTEEYINHKDFFHIENNFDKNVKNFSNIVKFKIDSDNFFLKNKLKFDAIYIDGYHYGPQVYKDCMNAWKFLNINGYLICDDYIWAFYPQIKDNPCYFINRFLNQIKGNFKIKKISNSQIFIKKIN